MSSSWNSKRVLGLPILAAIVAVSIPAAPALGRVEVIVLTENKKAVRSNVLVRVGQRVSPVVDTEADGRYLFESVRCTDKTQFKVEPKVRLYINDNKWLPCQATIVLRLRPVRVGNATIDNLPAWGKRSGSALAG